MSPGNRPSQDGSPIEAGERSSGEGLDLNRDGIKLESIEGKALMENVILRWDPIMFVDLHTTNGTWHGYSLTYAPGMATAGHPGTTAYLMESLFPEVTEKVRERSGLDTYLYGNFSEFPPETYSGMYTQPRYLTNSLALRNMLTILVETFAHDTFERRIASNLAFLNSLLEFTSEHSNELLSLISVIKNEVITEIGNMAGTGRRGVQFQRGQSGALSDLLVYSTETNIDQFGIERPRRTGRRYWVSGVRKLTGVDITRETTIPLAYVFPSSLSNVADKLREHGVTVQELGSSRELPGEEFIVTSFSQSPYNYQGHYLSSIDGYFIQASRSFSTGSYYVDLKQPLGWLCFYMLEPETDDGLTVWNYFDEYLINQGVNEGPVAFPVFKLYEPGMSSNPSGSEQDISFIFDMSSGNMELRFNNITTSATKIEVMDIAGKKLYGSLIPTGAVTANLPTSDFSPGVYVLKIRSGQYETTRKFAVN
jgi:dipeptidyl-peptidase-4